MKVCLVFISLFIFSNKIVSQDYKYEKFYAIVYKFPQQRKYQFYSEDYKLQPVIDSFETDDINIPQRFINEGFPNTSATGSFGIMFKSKLEIFSEGLYALKLESDDGSILWIDEEEIINNDYNDGMHAEFDTLALKEGLYEIRLWYFQGYPDQYGCVFLTEKLDSTIEIKRDTFLFPSKILFDNDMSSLNDSNTSQLDTFYNKHLNSPFSKFRIIGHTDDVGSSDYNFKLAEERALSVKNFFIDKYDLSEIKIETVSKGEEEPIVPNNSKFNRMKNRRVELVIERIGVVR